VIHTFRWLLALDKLPRRHHDGKECFHSKLEWHARRDAQGAGQSQGDMIVAADSGGGHCKGGVFTDCTGITGTPGTPDFVLVHVSAAARPF
jgi:hypothetical protein